ncbi:putative glutamine amidotransferase [[Candida] jaroonii]|uniref:Glutamine amidotransferase n=1 Tax=[Candida] jaroonii TaxID=467808 RepID=A0ACA9Y819_9ASCO|nr:putative glutamine amidotransferase [[Candida] jaroonii]
MTRHIAVLHCDKPIDIIYDKHGDLGDLCCKLLDDTGTIKFPNVKYDVFIPGESVEIETELSKIYVDLLTKIESKEIVGIFLSGSREDSFAEDLWIKKLDDFLKKVFQLEDFPISGVCFGHQIICKNLGFKVGRNPEGWEIGTTTINLNTEIFSIGKLQWIKFLKDELKVENHLTEHLNLAEIHADVVFGLNSSSSSISNATSSKFISIGSTSKCSIQGIITESGPIKVLTFQGHPEFSKEVTLDMLNNVKNLGFLDANAFEKSCYNTNILNNQGPTIGKFIAEFFNTLG